MVDFYGPATCQPGDVLTPANWTAAQMSTVDLTLKFRYSPEAFGSCFLLGHVGTRTDSNRFPLELWEAIFFGDTLEPFSDSFLLAENWRGVSDDSEGIERHFLCRVDALERLWETLVYGMKRWEKHLGVEINTRHTYYDIRYFYTLIIYDRHCFTLHNVTILKTFWWNCL